MTNLGNYWTSFDNAKKHRIPVAPKVPGLVDMLRRKAVASLSTMEQMASAAAKASHFRFFYFLNVHICLEICAGLFS